MEKSSRLSFILVLVLVLVFSGFSSLGVAEEAGPDPCESIMLTGGRTCYEYLEYQFPMLFITCGASNVGQRVTNDSGTYECTCAWGPGCTYYWRKVL